MNPSGYDAIFFESLSNPERHIDRLYAQAFLKGVIANQPRCANVLEIGCSTGSNIIPQAILYPESCFLGVDISRDQIAVAQEVSEALGLKNIEFVVVGVENLNRAPQSFDFIICHGLYSWVGLDTQRMLIKQIAHYLSPNGVAYLSYNTEIGWKNFQVIKRFLVECADESLDSHMKIARARKIITTALEIGRANELLCQSRTVQFLTYLATISDALLLHEYLNPHTSGISATKLDKELKVCELQYFGDARPQRESLDQIVDNQFDSSSLKIKQQMNSAVRDDLSDLFQPKSFRAALVVRAGFKEKRIDSSDSLRSLYFASPLVLLSRENDLHSHDAVPAALFMRGEEQPFRVFDEGVVRIITTLTDRWPVPVSGQSLFPPSLTDVQLREFMRLVWSGAIEVSFGSFGCSVSFKHSPVTSPYIRLQAQAGNIISTLKHEYFQANDFERSLLGLLDGSHTQNSLVDAMQSIFEAGHLSIAQGQIANMDREFFTAAVDMALREFAEHGLLLSAEYIELQRSPAK